MVINFDSLIQTLGVANPTMSIVPINGCCYGRDNKPEKTQKIKGEERYLTYYKFCGQKFWAFISGNENLYVDIVEPLGHRAQEKTEVFRDEYAKIINKFTKQFTDEFCDQNGAIKWDEVVKLSSATDGPQSFKKGKK